MDARTLWRGQPDTTRRMLGRLLALSMVLHAPFTPWAALIGALRAFAGSDEPPAEIEPLTAIPIDLLEEESPPTPPPAAAAPPEAAPPETPKSPERAPEQPKERDAGAPDAGAVDAGPKDAGEDGGPADGGVRERAIADPLAVKGDARKVIDSDANVQLRIFTSRIRKHPLGGRVGRLLGSVYQWRDFFGPAALDPIADVDQILVWGPQLRDSSQVGAVLKLNVPDDRIHGAVDALVKSDPEGHWIEDAGVPSAIARADRAPRHFVLPAPGVVVVVPPGPVAEFAAQFGSALAGAVRDRGGSEVVSAKVKTPWRAFRGVFKVPQSISFAKGTVTPTPDGGALIEIEAEDESPETANSDAAYLETTITSVTQVDLGLLGAVLGGSTVRFVEKVEFSAQGNKIYGRITLTQEQIRRALDFADSYINQPRPKRLSDAGVK